MSGRRHWILVLGLILVAAIILLWMGRPPICTCGTIKLWAGVVESPDNSQHIADWYSPSHLIHGFLFYAFGWLLLRRQPVRVRFIAAVAIEILWEVVENSQFIIDRYREATMALGYNGDSVLNSVSDIGWMMAGFLLAGRLPVWATTLLAIGFEFTTLLVIRDNLTLNVLMLAAPVDAIRTWQGG